MGNFAAGPGILREGAEDSTILEVSLPVAQRVHAFLSRPDVPDTFGWDQFMEEALRHMEASTADCEDDGSFWCTVHDCPMEPYGEDDGPQQCDTRADFFI